MKKYKSYEDYTDEVCEMCGADEASLLVRGLYVCKKCARMARKPNHDYDIEEEDSE